MRSFGVWVWTALALIAAGNCFGSQTSDDYYDWIGRRLPRRQILLTKDSGCAFSFISVWAFIFAIGFIGATITLLSDPEETPTPITIATVTPTPTQTPTPSPTFDPHPNPHPNYGSGTGVGGFVNTLSS